MPFRKLFLSRWSALLWAGGIVWTAVDIADVTREPQNAQVSDNQVDATGVVVNSNDLTALENVIKGD